MLVLSPPQGTLPGMRLDKLESASFFVAAAPDGGDSGSPRELYFDAHNGVVYALTADQAAERDPRYRALQQPQQAVEVE